MTFLRFDVVIPLRDMRAFAAAAVQSALRQTLPPARVIVVDDGSVDGGAAMLRHRFGGAVEVLPLAAPAGASAARNAGVRIATAPWIALLDADDLWAPGHLAELARIAAAVPDAALLGSAYRIGHEPPTTWGGEATRRVRIDYFDAYVRAPVPPISASSVAIDRHAFEAVGGFAAHLRFGEDGDLWERLALAYGVAVGDATTAFVRRHAASATARRDAAPTRPGPGARFAHVRAALHAGDVPHTTPAALRRYLDHHAFGVARGRLQRGDTLGATAWLEAAANPRGWRVRVWRAAARLVPALLWRVAARVWRAAKRVSRAMATLDPSRHASP